MRSQSSIFPCGLRCEYRENPLGIDVVSPRLSWRLEPFDKSARGCRQTAYEIVVGSTLANLPTEPDLWSTGRIQSDETIHIEYSGKPLSSGQQCWWMVRVWDENNRASEWSEPASWTVGLLEKSDWGAQWIEEASPPEPNDSPESLPASMFRREFTVPSEVRRATAYVTGLGVYELFINGSRVGDHILAPEWTAYRTRIQYQTYDVTELLRAGANAVGAWVGSGWYMGRLMLWGMCCYGNRARLLLRIEAELEDGSTRTVVTDETWKSSHDGPIRLNGIYDGEDYDARLEMPGWNEPGFDDTGWQPVRTVALGPEMLVWQPNEPIRAVEELRPVNVTSPSPGTYVFDLGQNMAGWCRIRAAGKAGQTIRVRHAEMLNDDGTIYTANLRTARATVNYTPSRDGIVEFEPHFTYVGFRYAEVTGLAKPPTLESITGRVIYSSSPDAGSIECSNAMLTKLAKNIYWTQRANLYSIPTDCPQRDERFGWVGDILVFAQTAIFNMDMAAFFTKWIRDVRDDQADDGRYPDFAPHAGNKNEEFTGAPAWGDAGTVVPWCQYQNYADLRMLKEHFESARRWVDYIERTNPDLIWREGRGNNYNDWLNGDTLIMDGWPREGATVPPDIFATAFFAHSTYIVARMAEVLGLRCEAERYSELYERIKDAFNRAFVKPDGRIESDTQAAYAIALNFDLLPDDLRPLAAAHLIEAIEKYNGHMSTGFHSSHRMLLELVRAGSADEAYRLALLTDFPSWGMMIENGATTIWERWDGFVRGRGFQDPGMNSFNHWAFGAVGEWMWRHIVGINPDDRQPGFKHFVVHPRPGGGLTWARGRYQSIRGTIESAWHIQDGLFTLNVTVPVGTTATVYLPTDKPQAAQSDGAELVSCADGFSVYLVPSGRYTLSCQVG